MKTVYFFGHGKADGNAQMRALLGGKGANLAEMTRIGLPVPPGFTITTEVCTYYYANRKTYPKVLAAQVDTAVARLESMTGKKFGDRENPLLVSVRSGARDSFGPTDQKIQTPTRHHLRDHDRGRCVDAHHGATRAVATAGRVSFECGPIGP